MPRRRKTNEEYIQECKDKGLDLPIEKYRGSKTKINHKCSMGHIYSQRPNDHLKGVGCLICSSKTKKTTEEYIQECEDKGYDLPIEDYINSYTKINHKCSKGHIYPQKPYSHLQGIGCLICSGKKKKTPEGYLQECEDKGLDLPIEDYIDAKTKINHKCNNGHVYEQRPNIHLQGYGCPTCKNKTPQDYLHECKDKGLDLPIEDYKGSNTYINHKCSKGHIYPQTPSNHLQGRGCSTCKESHGEKFIRNYLDSHCIKYISQKTFKDLKDKTYLSYDFYLPEHSILIEYQGIQHFESVSFNGKDYSDLDKQKRHDNLKRAYAKDNGYKLLELHYTLDTQEKVNNYLDKYLN